MLRVGDLSHGHHAGIPGQLDLVVEHVHYLVDVLGAQAVLVAVLHEALAGINHEYAAPGGGILLINHHDAGRDAGYQRKGWQAGR